MSASRKRRTDAELPLANEPPAQEVAAEGNVLALVAATPAIVLLGRKRFEDFYEAVRAEAEALEPDLATKRGREAIASMAFRIARTKTAIDDAGKKLNEDARRQIGVVDAARREIRERFDTLRDKVRAPLDEWERAEERRKADIADRSNLLTRLAAVPREATSADIEATIAELRALAFPAETFLDEAPFYVERRDQIVAGLAGLLERARQEEADRAELERLRREREERERAEEEARRLAEAAERERAAMEAAREAEARAEQERIARERQLAEEAAERARREEEQRARQEQERRDREHAAEVERLQRERDEAEAARQAEIVRQEEAARAAEKERERLAAERAAREADVAHRGNVMRLAKEALMEHAELDEATAKRVVLAITGNHVPAVRIAF